LGKLDMDRLPSGITLLGEFEDPLFNSPEKKLDYLQIYTWRGLLVVLVRGYADSYFCQDEFPLASFPWAADIIVNKMWKRPSEGGLPKGVFHVDATIDGESINLHRSFNLAGNWEGGFELVNASRLGYVGGGGQAFSFSDRLLLEGGLLEFMKMEP
jgi:hypothetical protein